MIFKRDLLALVLAGKKTETRRTWEICRVKVGRTYAVRGSRFEKAKGRVLVLATRQEKLGAITDAGVRAEGFASMAAFFWAWHSIHRAAPDLEELVWVVTFCRAKEVLHLEKTEHAHRQQQDAALPAAKPSSQGSPENLLLPSSPNFDETSSHTPQPCPECGKPMQPQGEGMEHFQICTTCGKGYNVNYHPFAVYWEAKKGKKRAPA